MTQKMTQKIKSVILDKLQYLYTMLLYHLRMTQKTN